MVDHVVSWGGCILNDLPPVGESRHERKRPLLMVSIVRGTSNAVGLSETERSSFQPPIVDSTPFGDRRSPDADLESRDT